MNRIQEGEDLQVTEDDQIRNLLRNLGQYKSTGPDKMHLRVMRELSHIVARVLCISFEKSHTPGESLSGWKKANATAIFKKGQEE